MQADPRAGEALPPHRSGIDAGPPRGHPASSGCVLDGTPAGFGSIDGAALSRVAGELRRFFSSPDALSTDILWHLWGLGRRAP
jgi:hypothetical protein